MDTSRPRRPVTEIPYLYPVLWNVMLYRGVNSADVSEDRSTYILLLCLELNMTALRLFEASRIISPTT